MLLRFFQSLKKFQDGTRQKKSSNPDFVFDRKMSFQGKKIKRYFLKFVNKSLWALILFFIYKMGTRKSTVKDIEHKASKHKASGSKTRYSSHKK